MTVIGVRIGFSGMIIEVQVPSGRAGASHVSAMLLSDQICLKISRPHGIGNAAVDVIATIPLMYRLTCMLLSMTITNMQLFRSSVARDTCHNDGEGYIYAVNTLNTPEEIIKSNIKKLTTLSPTCY